MKKLLGLVILGMIVASLVLASCSSSPTTTVPTSNVAATSSALSNMNITVASDATWPPFESINEQTKQIEGMDIDIFNAIAAKENLTVNFKNVAWDPLLAGMAQSMYDAAISSITITAEPAKRYALFRPLFCSRSDGGSEKRQYDHHG